MAKNKEPKTTETEVAELTEQALLDMRELGQIEVREVDGADVEFYNDKRVVVTESSKPANSQVSEESGSDSEKQSNESSDEVVDSKSDSEESGSVKNHREPTTTVVEKPKKVMVSQQSGSSNMGPFNPTPQVRERKPSDGMNNKRRESELIESRKQNARRELKQQAERNKAAMALLKTLDLKPN